MPNPEKHESIVIPGVAVRRPVADAIPKKFTMPVVYVLSMRDTPYVKIGSTSSVRARVVSLQGATPFKVDWPFYLCPSPIISHIDVELLAHGLLKGCRVRGEWFCCDDEVAIDAVMDAHEFLAEEQR